jgi:hypothetical protein
MKTTQPYTGQSDWTKQTLQVHMEGGVNHQESHLDGYDLLWENHQEGSQVAEDPLEEDSQVVEEDSRAVEGHQHPFLFPQH